nr:hypothetical protein Q903MT_gene2067 [Picea sitchensis]
MNVSQMFDGLTHIDLTLRRVKRNLSVTYRLPRLRNSFTEMGIMLLVIIYICNSAFPLLYT